jgi:oligopeptide/dipeptide ABC transporter ATP-binding protein
MTVVSGVLICALVVLAIVAPIVWGKQALTPDPAYILKPPSGRHLLGTDNLGRDILLRTLVATRLSLLMALVATALSALLGLAVGAVPVVLGRRAQRAFGSVINTWLAFPVLLVAMLTLILLGSGTSTAVIALVLTMTPSFARLAQTLGSRVGGSDYLAAARMLGVSRRRQITRYVVPNIAEPVLVNVTMSIGGALLSLSSLSFLGVGVQPPSYDWGRMLGDSLSVVYTNPAAVIGPAVAVVLAGLAFGMLGESLAAHLRAQDHGKVAAKRVLGPAPVADRAVEPAPPRPDALLEVDGMSVAFPGEHGWIHPVRDVSLSVGAGEIVGLVGESGSGKSVTMMAVARLAAAGAVVDARTLRFGEEDLRGLAGARLRAALTSVGVVFQDSLTALNPAMRIGPQLAEAARVKRRVSRRAAGAEAVDALAEVAIDAPARRATQFPHELSGGMRQRVLIAMSQLGRPSLIIADEPTTALDVMVQRRVLGLLRRECARSGAAAIVVSHDIAVLGELCGRILVMYAGRIVEEVDASLLADTARLAHPYTRALVDALPGLDTDRTQPLATIPGEPPDLSQPVTGCGFAPRCAFATERCHAENPVLAAHPHGGRVACWHPQDALERQEAAR